jgi:arabinofuranosyltransferase
MQRRGCVERRAEASPHPGHRRLLLGLIGAAVLVGTFAGWKALWFLTDDAFIAFRYVSNGVRGWGLVWNPPPFAPVEGYTSFLWVTLLRLVWQLTGVAPPQSANWLSLGFGYVTLFLGYRILERMVLPPALARWRLALLALVMLGTVANPTFLTWLSSGLETSLFAFCLTWWLHAALTPPVDRGASWVFQISLSATCMAMARPDGLLFFAATLLLLALVVALRNPRGVPGSWWAAALPLLGVPAHLLWRRFSYGYWLPNSYYAKHVGAWPESGLRYLESFAIEYGVWVWGLLALAWLARALVRGRLQPGAELRQRPQVRIAVGALLGHFAYYTFIVGGDHFEYRVYSHLILLLFLSAVWLLARVTARPWLVCAGLALFVAASLPIPWAHWSETRALSTRAETGFLFRPLSRHLPAWARPLVRRWEDSQKWLIRHSVCRRRREHQVFYETSVRAFPPREEGARISWEDRVVLPHGGVGVLSWVLPEVAIIDVLGLNDRVVARNPVNPRKERYMAHDRLPPLGYIDCFRPNARVVRGSREIRIEPRAEPLTDEEIRGCKSRFLADVLARRDKARSGG